MDDNDYLQEGFNPNSLKIIQLRSVLNRHGVDYSAASKKSEYVALFNEHIAPRAAELLKEWETAFVPNGSSIIDARKEGMSRNFASEIITSSPSPSSSSSSSRDRSPVRSSKKNLKNSSKRRERDSDSDSESDSESESDNETGSNESESEDSENATTEASDKSDDDSEEEKEVSFSKKNYFQTGSEKNKEFIASRENTPSKTESLIPAKRGAPAVSSPRKKKVLRKLEKNDDYDSSSISTDNTPEPKKKYEEEPNVVINLTPIAVKDTVAGKGSSRKLSSSYSSPVVSSPLKFSPVNLSSSKSSSVESEPKVKKVSGPKKVLSFDEKSSPKPEKRKRTVKETAIEDVEIIDDEEVVEVIKESKETVKIEESKIVEETKESTKDEKSEKSPKSSKISTFFFTLFVFLYFAVWISIPVLSYAAVYLRELKLNAGFCGYSSKSQPTDFVKALSINSALPQIVPYIREFESYLEEKVNVECTPCPEHAICRENFNFRCEYGFVKYQPWSKLTMGNVPFFDYCVPDSTTEEKIEVMSSSAMEQISKSRKNGESNLSLEELHDLLYKLKSPDTTNEEFEEEWNVYVAELEDDDIPLVSYKGDEITFEEQTPSEYLTSSDFGIKKKTKMFSKYPPSTSTAEPSA